VTEHDEEGIENGWAGGSIAGYYAMPEHKILMHHKFTLRLCLFFFLPSAQTHWPLLQSLNSSPFILSGW